VEKYRILIKSSATQELDHIPKRDLGRVVKQIQNLSEAPRPSRCERLSGEEKYRVRQGKHRVVYSVDDESREVFVVKIGHRREVYR
jgi:mRNA interferase RelE/StbE